MDWRAKVFMEQIMARVRDKSKNAICVFNGATGSGKTYSALAIAEYMAKELGTNFSVAGNMAFDFGSLLKKTMLDKNKEPCSIFLFEEVGSMGLGAASRQWQSKANLFFSSFLQTTRHRRQILLFTCPLFSNLDVTSRQLCHFGIEMRGINYKHKLGIIKPLKLQTNISTGKIYRKYIRVVKEGVHLKLKTANIKHPSKQLTADYEKEKLKFTTALNQSIIEATEIKPKEKKNTRSSVAMIEQDFHALWKAGIRKPAQFCRMLNITPTTFYRKMEKFGLRQTKTPKESTIEVV